MQPNLVIIRSIFAVFVVAISITSARADTAGDFDAVVDWLESEFPELLSPVATSQTFDVWRYRYYSDLDFYVGVNDENDVYVLGDIVGGLQFVAPLAGLLALVPETSAPPAPGTGGVIDPGNGNCITSAFPAAGLVGEYETTFSVGIDGLRYTTTILESSSSVFTQRIEQSADIPGFGTTSSNSVSRLKIRIEGNLVYAVSNETDTTTTAQGLTSTTDSVTTYDPDQLSGTLTVCEGQVFQIPSVTATTVATSTINGVSTTETSSITTGGVTVTTESIADRVTTAAGVFTAVRARSEDRRDGSYTRTWVDRNTNMTVKAEIYDANGVLQSTNELISLSN